MSRLQTFLFSAALLAVQTLSGATFATFNAVSNNARTGNLSGIDFSISPVTTSSLPSADLSGPNFSFDPGSASQTVLQHASANSWTISFNTAVPFLEVYAILWRPAAYSFSLTPTIASGLTNATLSTNSLLLPSNGGFGSGILTFTNVTELSLTTSFTGGGVQQTQFAVPGAAIPEPSTLSLLAAGTAFLLYRAKRQLRA